MSVHGYGFYLIELKLISHLFAGLFLEKIKIDQMRKLKLNEPENLYPQADIIYIVICLLYSLLAFSKLAGCRLNELPPLEV